MTSQMSDTPTVNGGGRLDPPSADERVGRALRDLGVVAARLATGDGRFEESRVPIRILCAAAREAGLPPERLLIRLKHAMDQSGFPAGADGGDRATLRSRIISLAIVEYFTAAEPGATGI
jgi:hypothetical protein